MTYFSTTIVPFIIGWTTIASEVLFLFSATCWGMYDNENITGIQWCEDHLSIKSTNNAAVATFASLLSPLVFTIPLLVSLCKQNRYCRILCNNGNVKHNREGRHLEQCCICECGSNLAQDPEEQRLV